MRSSLDSRFSPRRVLALALAVAALTGCERSTTGLDDDIHASEVRRLLVADYEAPRLQLVDMGQANVLQSFTTATPTTGLYASETRRFAFAFQADGVEIFDGGVWADDHGDHGDLKRSTPERIAIRMGGPRPSHLLANDGWVGVFFDDDGVARFTREQHLFTRTNQIVQASSGAPHHGAALAMAGSFFTTVKDPNKAGTLPDSVRRFNQSGQAQQTFGPCRDIHGDAANRNAAVFGCLDGVLVVRHNAGQFTSQFYNTTGALDGFGVRAFQGRTDQPYFVTRSGNAQVRILAKFDPATGALTRVPLPAGYPLAWEVDPTGRHMVVFDESGAVHVVNMETVALEGTMSGVTAAYASSERSRAPHLAVAEGLAYMTSPKTGEVLVIDYRARAVRSRIAVGGMPGRLVLLGPDRDMMLEAH